MTEPYPHPLDYRSHLEPAATHNERGRHQPHPHSVALSQAISLKRIADALAPPNAPPNLLLGLIEQMAER